MKVETFFCIIKTMKFYNYFKNFTIFLLTFCICAIFAAAQTPNFTAPRENKLLNGTKLLVWNDKTANKVTVKVRVHSGSAFDALGKEGTMQLLADILFPTETTKEFFAEDLNGSFEVLANYDYIQINATGDADKLLTILETLAPAVTNPQINKETTGKVRAALLLKVKELEKNPAYVADQTVAKRLLGNFPYGRPQLGSSESVAKLDFADVLYAYQKFFTADNATITISGNVNPDFALRASKRLFGGWLKSDKKIPATFAQPEMPANQNAFVELPNAETAELRQAVRGLARNDKDFAASLIVRKILEERLETAVGIAPQSKTFVRNDSHLLPGLMMLGGSVSASNAKSFMESAHKADFFKPLTQAEFDKAKSSVLAGLNASISTSSALADAWLDTETFKLAPLSEQLKTASNATLIDGEKVLDRFFRKTNIVNLLVADANTIKELTGK